MRQFFTFRFWLSVIAVLALLGFLFVQVRDIRASEPDGSGGTTEREINMITRVLAARLDPGWTGRDGMTIGSAEIDTGYGATLAIKPGTLAQLQCDALTTPGGCFLVADTLGNAVIWFAVLPYPTNA